MRDYSAHHSAATLKSLSPGLTGISSLIFVAQFICIFQAKVIIDDKFSEFSEAGVTGDLVPLGLT